ncbi:MAG: transposase [Paracoccaceae bacterium]
MHTNTRSFVPGGQFFFTVRLQDRNATLLTDEVVKLRAAMRVTKARAPFAIDAIVVLPSVIHTIWTLPPQDADYAKRWGLVKSLFSRGVSGPEQRAHSPEKRRDKGIWQRRFWEHKLRDLSDLDAHIQLIHSAPVQAGLCAKPEHWPYSSVHRHFAPDPVPGHFSPLRTPSQIQQHQHQTLVAPLGRA